MIYERFANYYDQFIDQDLYDTYLELITKHKKEGNVIDLGTGTGPLAILLTQNNFYVTGTDISEKMLERAYDNAVHAGVHINFFVHNILDPLNQTYDVITMISDVINYLDNEREVKQVFTNIKNAMSKGSIFVFDFLHPQYINNIHGYSEDILLNDEVLEWSVRKTNVENQIRHYLKFGSVTETHYQTTFPLKKYKEMLNESGLSIIKKKRTDERIILLCKLK